MPPIMAACSFLGGVMLPDRSLPWPIAWAGVVEIAQSEDCRLVAYRDIAGIWTLGWGETEGIVEGMRWTQAEADARLCQRLAEFAAGVQRRLRRPATPNQLAALVSLAYNIGLGAIERSTVLKAHNAGDTLAAARAFGLFDKARIKGKLQQVRALAARRARESALYLQPEPAADVSVRGDIDAVPAAVPAYVAAIATGMPEAAPQPSLAASPTVQSGTASIATGALAAASAVSADVRNIAWSIGIDPVLVVAVVAIVAGAVVLWRRYRQRRGGWA